MLFIIYQISGSKMGPTLNSPLSSGEKTWGWFLTSCSVSYRCVLYWGERWRVWGKRFYVTNELQLITIEVMVN